MSICILWFLKRVGLNKQPGRKKNPKTTHWMCHRENNRVMQHFILRICAFLSLSLLIHKRVSQKWRPSRIFGFCCMDVWLAVVGKDRFTISKRVSCLWA